MPVAPVDTRRRALIVAWAGLATALVELTLRGVQRYVLHRTIYLGPQVVWMTPLADLLLALLIAALLAAIGLAWPAARTFRAWAGALGFLGTLSVLTMQPWLHWWAVIALAAGTAAALANAAGNREAAVQRLMTRTVPVFLAVVLALAGVVNTRLHLAERRAVASLPSPPRAAPNVLFIVWDAVRAADVSAFGYQRPTTPALEALAAGGIAFDRAIAPAPYTLPSHASFFTGRWAHQLDASWSIPFGPNAPTLSEALAQRGYRTAGFSANHIYVTYEFGLQRGFGHWEDYKVSVGELVRCSALLKWLAGFDRVRTLVGWHDALGRRDATEIGSQFLGWLARSDSTRPFFAFLNMFDAHEPYLPPAPFDTLFRRPSEAAPPERTRERAQRRSEGRFDETQPEVLFQRDQYDGAIAEMDRELDHLLGELDRRGLLRNTLTVVLSDHGEAFGEHDALSHGNDVYSEVLRVPLVLSLPGRIPAGLRISQAASLRDLPATVADLLGFAGSSWPLSGQSLARFWRVSAAAPPPSDTVLAEVERIPRGGQPWHPVRRGDVRSMLAWPNHLITLGREMELYDLDADPGEHHDLARDSGHAATRDALAAALRRWRQDAVPTKRP